MRPRSTEARVGIYRNFALAIFLLGFVGWLAFRRRSPVEAALLYGAVVVLAGVLLGYVAGFERGKEHERGL